MAEENKAVEPKPVPTVVPEAALPVVVDKFSEMLGVERLRLEVESKRIDYQTKAFEKDAESFDKANELAGRDRKDSRETFLKGFKAALWTIGIVLVGCLLLAGCAMMQGNPTLAASIVSGVLSLLAGAVGGYGFGQSRGFREGQKRQSDSQDRATLG